MCRDDDDPLEKGRIGQLRLISTGGFRQEGHRRPRRGSGAGIHDPPIAGRHVLHEAIQHACSTASRWGCVGQRQERRQPHLRVFSGIQPRFD